MSQYGEFETTMSDQSCLVAALEDLGYKPIVTDIPMHLTGYQGDMREQTAEIIIPRYQLGSASNDVGYKRTDNGTFKAIISNYDQGYIFGKDKQTKVAARYAVHKNLNICKKKGYKVHKQERKLINGRWATVIKAKA